MVNLTIVIVAVLFTVLLPAQALAWGPATHLELGWNIVQNCAFAPAAIRTLIQTFSYDFIYGNISADIVVAKSLMDEVRHCHNWRVGFNVLDRAESDSQRAFSYGYLSHLAADTVAHNIFIPEMMVRSFSTTIHRHIYWEMRFDALVDKSVWKLPDKMVKNIHDDNDRLLNSVLEGTPLSFKNSKRVFKSVIAINRVNHWHSMIDMLSKNSKWALHREDKDKWTEQSMEVVREFLSNPEGASCLGRDPTGKKNLQIAADARKRLRSLKRSGGEWQNEQEEAIYRIHMV